MAEGSRGIVVNFPILGILGVAFIVLKLCGVIAWSWFWVTAPFLMPGVLLVLFVIICLSWYGIQHARGVDIDTKAPRPMQTKIGSFVEAWANIGVGFAVNWCANMLILPLFGFHVTGTAAFEIGLWFTAVSLVRQYVLRRWFNGLRFGNRA